MKKVYIALGSNVGHCGNNLFEAFKRLQHLGNVQKSSAIYQNSPMYHSEQPLFYNAACLLETTLEPANLLSNLKSIENDLGRTITFRNGPRAIDLDILFYGNDTISTTDLCIPHPRVHERRFALKPLCDLNPQYVHPTLGKSMDELLAALPPLSSSEIFRKVIPCYNKKLNTTKYINLESGQPIIMGILNVTPDSFSDGGIHNKSIETAVEHAIQLIANGAHIIDIGGESTRPNAETIDVSDEIQRIIPVIKGIRERNLHCLLSIDTRKAAVAKAALDAGADIINDVSAGQYDPDMLSTVTQYGVPYIAMHMRGEPHTMLATQNTTYKDVLQEVSQELKEQLNSLDAVFPRWLQIVDPGLGFAKGFQENKTLLSPKVLQTWKASLENRPLLVGISRKRTLSQLLVENNTKSPILVINQQHQVKEEESKANQSELSIRQRDMLTAGACCAAILGGADILRVHNVEDVKLVTDTFQSLI